MKWKKHKLNPEMTIETAEAASETHLLHYTVKPEGQMVQLTARFIPMVPGAGGSLHIMWNSKEFGTAKAARTFACENAALAPEWIKKRLAGNGEEDSREGAKARKGGAK